MYEVSNEVVEVKEEAELLRLQMEVAQQEEEAARSALAAAQAALAAALAAPDESADAPAPQVLSILQELMDNCPFPIWQMVGVAIPTTADSHCTQDWMPRPPRPGWLMWKQSMTHARPGD